MRRGFQKHKAVLSLLNGSFQRFYKYITIVRYNDEFYPTKTIPVFIIILEANVDFFVHREVETSFSPIDVRFEHIGVVIVQIDVIGCLIVGYIQSVWSEQRSENAIVHVQQVVLVVRLNDIF
jgi:hypothetical protein